TQLTSLPALLAKAGAYFGSALGGDSGSRLAVLIVLFFSLCGFLFGYLWTRLFLAGELAKADWIAIEHSRRQLEKAQDQVLIDGNAIRLASQYLNEKDVSTIPVQEMKEVIADASGRIRSLIFSLAREARGKWRADKWRI